MATMESKCCTNTECQGECPWSPTEREKLELQLDFTKDNLEVED